MVVREGQKNVRIKFAAAMKRLIGKLCWGVAAGEGTGSVFVLDFGSKILRRRPLDNPSLTSDQRNYQGQYAIQVWCSWRIDLSSGVLCGSKNTNTKRGRMIQGLGRLVVARIVSVDVLKNTFDLAVKFDNGLVLRVFCDETNPSEPFDNYSLFAPKHIYTVENRSVGIARELRTDRPGNSGQK